MMFAVVKQGKEIRVLNTRDHPNEFIRGGAEGIVRNPERELIALTNQEYRANQFVAEVEAKVNAGE